MGCFKRLPSGDKDDRDRQFDQIVGKSPALEAVLEQVERVAPTSATVLIQGETGTGKELIAKAIHNISPRYDRPYVKLNCGAIPVDLLESELFGHEKGAFTGAIAQKIGRFELADKGTLFLDEVGDIPLALQPKLLRILQEQEFERLGSGRTHRVDVRLVAATHRDLEQMVKRNEFRSDLYYRLNVFPVLVPPLRARREDILPLVKHYVEVFAQRMSKRIDHIPAETLAKFESYSWPGNIRELQNLVERAVVLSNDGVLPNPLPRELQNVIERSVILCETQNLSVDESWLLQPATFPQALGLTGGGAASLPLSKRSEGEERQTIETALTETRGRVAGPSGAAGKLGIPASTLESKIRALKIDKYRFKSQRSFRLGL